MKETDPKVITNSLQSCNAKVIITSAISNQLEELQLEFEMLKTQAQVCCLQSRV